MSNARTGVVGAEDVDDTPQAGVPDPYLIDVNLPGEDGFSLAQPRAGTVVMTARGQLQDRLQGYHVGADNYLTKPVEQAEMLACINSLAMRLKPPEATHEADIVLDSQALRLHGPLGDAPVTQGEDLLLASMCRAAGSKLERWQTMQLIDPNDKGLVAATLDMRISAMPKQFSACGAPSDANRTLRGDGYALSCAVTIG